MEDHSEKIQDYIEGHLEGDDLVQFEAQLQVDDELRNLLNLQKEVNEILTKRVISEEVELRGTLQSVANNFRHDPNAKIINFKKIITILAAASILIIGTLFIFKGKQGDLYELPILHSEVVRGHQENVSYESAIKAFNNKEYTVARNQFEALLLAAPDQIQYAYYLGLTYVGDGNWQTAIEQLKPIASGSSVFADEATYYLAVAYYESGDKSQAKIWLNLLSSNRDLKEKAAKLLDKIK